MIEEYQSLEPIHEMFSLSYANYLVLHRSLLQSMPVEWQQKFVDCINELDQAFSHIKRPDYFVQAAEQREVCELSELQRQQALDGEITEMWDKDDPDHEGDPIYHLDGNEIDSWRRVHLPIGDPIPHYNRGRTRILLSE
jgi:hypothetical protein